MMDFLDLSSQPSFVIFQEEPLHQKVANKLQFSNNLILRAISCSNEHITKCQNNAQFSLRLVSDLQTLHHQLSKLPPGVFEVVNGNFPSNRDSNPFLIDILRVGKVTGDLCVKIVGSFDEILHVSKVLCIINI